MSANPDRELRASHAMQPRPASETDDLEAGTKKKATTRKRKTRSDGAKLVKVHKPTTIANLPSAGNNPPKMALSELDRVEELYRSLIERGNSRLEATTASLMDAENRVQQLQLQLESERCKSTGFQQVVDSSLNKLDELSSQQEEFRSTLAERMALATRLEEELKHERARAAELAQLMASRDGQVEELGASAEKLLGEKVEIEARLAERTKLSMRLDEELTQGRARAAELAQLVALRDCQLEELGASAEKLLGEKAEIEARLAERMALATRLEEELKQERARTVELAQSMASRDGQVEELGASAEKLLGEKAEIEARLAERMALATRLEEELKQERARTVELAQSMASRDGQVEELVAATETLRGEKAEIEAKLERKEVEFSGYAAAVQTELSHERQRNSTLSAELVELKVQGAASASTTRRLQEALANTEVEFFSVRHELADTAARLSQKLQKIAQLEDYYEGALQERANDKRELDRQLAHVNELQATVASSEVERQRLTTEYDNELTKRTQEIERLLAQLTEADAHGLATLQKSDAFEGQINALRLDVERSHERAVEAEKKLSEYASKYAQVLRRLDEEIARRDTAETQKSREVEQRFDAQRREIHRLRKRIRQAERDLTESAVTLVLERELVSQRDFELASTKRGQTRSLNNSLRAVGGMIARVRGARLASKDPNPLFDAEYYLERYTDVRLEGVDAYAHYLDFGAEEGRDPNPMFDTIWYLERYPDVKEAGINPLLHYYMKGAAEGRDPHPLFSTAWYLEQNPDLALSKVNPLLHFLQSRSLAA